MSSSQTIKQKVFTYLTKLSDRDTHSLAASELVTIARSLDTTTVPVFLSCLYSTDASDKSPVRKQCVYLFGILSETHGNALSPYLSKIIANIIRRLRDTDTSVRSACVNSVSALACHVTKQPFLSFLKPLSEALFTEQEQNAQIGAALCLSSAIDGAPDPDSARLAKLLPKFQKLLKREVFKAKPALLTLIGSVIEAGGASGHVSLKNLVPCLVESLSNRDWAVRKAAAETLVVLANVERDFLSEFKSDCLKDFENRRFDKVKLVREVMIQMLESWKHIPDTSDEFSPPPKSQSSSKENGSDGDYPPISQSSCNPGSVMANLRRKSAPVSRFSPPDSSSASNGKNGDLQETDENETSLETNKIGKNRFLRPEMNRALLNKNSDDRIKKHGGSKAGSRVVPYHDESQSSAPVSNVAKDLFKKDKESEELSLIRNQLHQIEKQQSSLLDLLQKFMGTSQNGMQSLETRVHGLELALDDISYDLAVSNGRITNSNVPRNTCCLLSGADFFSSKFWKRTQGQYSSPLFSRRTAAPSLASKHYPAGRNAETNFTSQRFRLDGGFITNPLAAAHTNSRGFA
ncbi:unnamed protein product [Lathyrus oleraceus]